MTLTCTTLDQHERKNYLRLIFTLHTLFDDMWCLLDFNSFPDTGIGHQLEFLLYEKKKNPFLMQMGRNAAHVNYSLHSTVMFVSTH